MAVGFPLRCKKLHRTCAPLVEIASLLECPTGPEAGDKVNEAKKCKHEVDEDGNPERECYDDDYDDGPEPVAPRVSVAKSLPPPHLTLPAVQVIYFDIHGRLIVRIPHDSGR